MAGGYNTVVAGTVITASAHNQYVRNQVISRFASASARDSAITSPEEGMYADLADADALTRYTGSAWDLRPFPQFAHKSADEIVNNSATLQNDNHLSWAVLANGVYVLDLHLSYVSGTTPDLKLGWTGPAGAALVWGGTYADTTGAFGTQGNLTIANTAAICGSGAALHASFWGRLTVAGTAGALQLQWAQNTATVSDTTLLAGSYGNLTRVS